MRLEHETPLGPRLAVRKYRLDNGLSVLHVPDHAAPVVAVQIWYRVGSRHERVGRTGIAHLFEHLMFNQTENLAAGEFDRLVEAAGGDSNAATWVDWTYYQLNLPASGVELAIRLEAERMQHLTLTHAQVEAEREVVANERRLRVDDDVDGFLEEQLWKLAFREHPYHWPTIGWMEDIMAISTADCLEFYRQYYAPGNAALVVVGDIVESRLAELVGRYFAPIPAFHPPVEPPVREPPQTEERRQSWPKPVSADRVVVGYKAPAHGQDDWLALSFALDVLAGGAASRLNRRLVVNAQIAASAEAHLSPFALAGLAELRFDLHRGHGADEALTALDEEVARLVEGGVTAEEVEKVRNRTETAFYGGLTTCDGKAETLGMTEATLGDFRHVFHLMDRMGKVTAAEVQAAAARYLRPECRTVVVAEPSGDEQEEEDDA